jgi:hypothetical protein
MPTRYSGFFHPVPPDLDHIWSVVSQLKEDVDDLKRDVAELKQHQHNHD